VSNSVRFSVLGGVRAWRDGVEVDLGARQPRLMTAMLLARGGQLVAVSELVDLLWGGDPPPTAVNVVHRHIGAIRRWLEPGLARRAEGDWLVRKPGGYRIGLPADTVDLLRFRSRTAEAAAGLRAGHLEAAVAAYRDALDLWVGRFGEGLGADTHPLFVAVNRERAVAACAAADAVLHTSMAPSLLPVLQAAAAVEPFDEALQARLLLLLAVAGRSAEAIEQYHRFRQRLVADLGMGPGREMVAAFERVLGATRSPARDTLDPIPHIAAVSAAPASALPVRALVPAQLPPGSTFFVGRQHEREELHRMLEEGVEQNHGAAVLAVDGMPGVGKTALAVQWAHEVATRFTDGQLFLSLRGFGEGEPLPTGEALAQLLCALGVPYAELPPTVESRAAQFRTLTAGRKLLILLDDVHDAEQIRPLIPAAPGSLVIATSRGRLTGLAAADGAFLLTVDVPPVADARALLWARLSLPAPLGRPDEEMLETVVERAGCLPLALAIAAVRISEYSPKRPRDMAACMAGRASLDVFIGDDADSDMRSVFERSYRRLSPEAARLFRSLGRAGTEVDPDGVAQLAGTTRASATVLLSELVRHGLLTRTCLHRYALHVLVRQYAEELAGQRLKQRRLRLVRSGAA